MPINITCDPGSTITNKTGGWRTFIPRTDLEHCISCGACARVCPENCVQMIKNTPPAGGGDGGGGSVPLLSKESPSCPKGDQGGVGGGELAPEGKLKPRTDYAFCKGCGVCAAECPVKVIKMELEKK